MSTLWASPTRLRRWRMLVLSLLGVLAAVGCGGGEQDVSAPDRPDAALSGHEHTSATLIEVGRRQAADGRFETLLAERPGGRPSLVEVSAVPPGATAEPAQRASADELAAAVKRATARYARREDAERAGFEPWRGIDEFHFVNLAHVTDGAQLDPERPEFLMYDHDGRLVAAMFLPPERGAHGDQLGGPLTVWHYHPWPGRTCWSHGGMLPGGATPDRTSGTCPDGMEAHDRSPEMLHVWVVDHPTGPFSSNMSAVLFGPPGSSSPPAR
jgi:hypothetical protein